MKICALAGDGIGPEVMAQALRVLDKIRARVGHQIEVSEALVGGAAYDRHQNHLPQETLEACKKSDAILFGSVGGPIADAQLPKWKNCEVNALLGIRKAFNFFANLRPCEIYQDLKHISPLKEQCLGTGTSVLIVRELLGDIYFGAKVSEKRENQRYSSDLCEYNETQIANIARVAFRSATMRKGLVTSVDKANVLQTSKLWREVVSEVATEYPKVKLEHMLVDNCAMQLVTRPNQFDVVLTSNMFGDILSDLASVLPGSLGMTPSASLNLEGFGLYEPSGGSAPDIAGKGLANPSAQILSLALMLRYSLKMEEEARAVEVALQSALEDGARTADIAGTGEKYLSTSEFTDRILGFL